MAQDSPRYALDPRAAGLRRRVVAAVEWGSLSVEDRAFLTECIRDVERGDRPSGTAHTLGDPEEARRRARVAAAPGVPDTSGPSGAWSTAPDAPSREEQIALAREQG